MSNFTPGRRAGATAGKENVVVIGGGNVAVDVARTALGSVRKR
jgi:NADPH-dependent glutamate synthase beta subunit-like oxidoreductase